MKPKITIDEIDALLPQTQCRLCTYDDCRDYATAIVQKEESIDLCRPGGETVLYQLAEKTGEDPNPLVKTVRKQYKAIRLAVIREDECIGCTKCIQACPVDAIIGSSKLMHTVITDACNGCELCITPCPVDCIDMISHPKHQDVFTIAKQSRKRYEHHQSHLKQRIKKNRNKYRQAKIAKVPNTQEARKADIQAALTRKKSNRKKSGP